MVTMMTITVMMMSEGGDVNGCEGDDGNYGDDDDDVNYRVVELAVVIRTVVW